MTSALLDQIERGLDGVTAWLPKRRWEQMTAAEPWLTNIVYSEDQGKFFECVPLYSAEYVSDLEARATAAEATVAALHEKLRVAEEALEYYANPEIYKPHPHGPAFDRRDVSFCARTAIATIRRTK